MAERVLITSNMFKVSAPGHNASTASFENLLIDSTAPNRAISGYQIGSAAFGGPAYDPWTGTITGGQATVNFPNRGFPPLVFWQVNYNGLSISQGFWSAMPGASGEQGEDHGGYIDVFNDRVTFHARTPHSGILYYMICHAEI